MAINEGVCTARTDVQYGSLYELEFNSFIYGIIIIIIIIICSVCSLRRRITY